MDIFVVRHAPAEDQAPDGTDASRRLTPDGAKKFERAVKGLEHLGVQFDLILHSPYARAVETAEILSSRLTDDGKTEVCAELAAAPSRLLLARIQGAKVALVGHEPWLSELTAWLLLGSTEAGAHLPLKRGAVHWLEGEPRPGACVLVAALPPGVLRAL